MDASGSGHPSAHTPSQASLLPALSPSAATQNTPAQIHSLPPHMQQQSSHAATPPGQHPQLSTSRPPSAQPTPQPQHSQFTMMPQGHPQAMQGQSPVGTIPGHMTHPHYANVHGQQPMTQAQQGQSSQSQMHQHPQPPAGMTMHPGQTAQMMAPPAGPNGIVHQGGNVFGVVMGHGPGQVPGSSPGPGSAKVYASVYSGIPVFEAMIRGISVMRRTSDSWVNATQILKVAGIPKSARTKILEKEILTGVHEKVQGGYGKYQGTWIPFQRGQELAAQYGVTAFLSPIFDFQPSSTAVPALPVASGETPERNQKTPAPAHMGMNAGLMPSGRVASPFAHGQPGPPFTAGENGIMGIPPHPSTMAYPSNMYYQPQLGTFNQQEMADRRVMGMEMTPSKSGGPGAPGAGLEPAADISGMGLPPSHSDVYIDQYGQPHHTYQAQQTGANGDMAPPPKRQKSDQNGTMEQTYADGQQPEVKAETTDRGETHEGDDDSLDEFLESEPLPSAMRLSTKPSRPLHNAQTARLRVQLLSLFADDETTDLRAALGYSDDRPLPGDLDIDLVIDNQGHTALHWACALAKMPVVTQLLSLGADVHRGNYAGETPLIRAALTNNHSENGTFNQLISLLSPSIQTLDHAHRTVVHHIAMIAGVKGRAPTARTYMANVLEWVSRDHPESTLGMEGGGVGLKNLIDVQDLYGDTALNVAARVGSKGLINLLLDAGADKARANKMGLKPQDFGIEVDSLKISPAEAVVSSLKSEIVKPERRSRDVQRNISAIFETINDTFAAEMTQKQTTLNATEQNVRHATRGLAEKRQEVQNAQSSVAEIEQLQQKVENLRRALSVVSTPQLDLDWTGRNPLSAELSGQKSISPAFRSLPSGIPAPMASGSGVHIPIPPAGEQGESQKLKRLAIWEERMAEVLEDKIKALEGETADKAVKYRKLVSLCTKVPVEKVDGALDVLTTAIESDGQSIDLSRIAGFMSRLKEARAS